MDRLSEYIIASTEKILTDFEKKSEMLEYPEIQADKKLYLRLLAEYNDLKPVYDAKNDLLKTTKDLDVLKKEYETATPEERSYLSEEIECLNERKKNHIAFLKSRLSSGDALPCGATVELRAGNSAPSCSFIETLSGILSDYALRQGFTFTETKRTLSGKTALPRLIILETDSADASVKLQAISGTHKLIYASAETQATDEINITVLEKHKKTTVNEDTDLKIELYHSGGAGGQNINKVETAIRVIHIPTGVTVTCQDERSQLKNKLRAIENIKKRIAEKEEKAEKEYDELTRRKQAEIRKKIVFNLIRNIVVDKRTEHKERTFSLPFSPGEADVFIENI